MKGRSVALVHEGVCDMRMWDELVGPLAREFTVLRYDLRGYGDSTLPPGPFSQSSDLLGLLDHVGIERAALVGVSYGGRVALDTAFVSPERVTALVLAAPGLRDHEWSASVREFGEEEERLLDSGDVDGATELNVRLWVDGPNRGAGRGSGRASATVSARCSGGRSTMQLAAYEADPPPGSEDPVALRLGEIAAPTLVIVGDADVPDFLEIADELEAGLPDARKVVLADQLTRCPSSGRRSSRS